jgi:uncharacterized protein (DUF1501 family)
MDLWTSYQPTDETPWNLKRVVHLHRRAAFAAPWEIIQRDINDQPAIAVDRILNAWQHKDDEYAKNRFESRVAAKEALRLDDENSLHPSMKEAKELFDDGRLEIVQAVGYPNPDRSHFRSMRIWQTTSFEDADNNSYGWLGHSRRLS